MGRIALDDFFFDPTSDEPKPTCRLAKTRGWGDLPLLELSRFGLALAAFGTGCAMVVGGARLTEPMELPPLLAVRRRCSSCLVALLSVVVLVRSAAVATGDMHLLMVFHFHMVVPRMCMLLVSLPAIAVAIKPNMVPGPDCTKGHPRRSWVEVASSRWAWLSKGM